MIDDEDFSWFWNIWFDLWSRDDQHDNQYGECNDSSSKMKKMKKKKEIWILRERKELFNIINLPWENGGSNENVYSSI